METLLDVLHGAYDKKVESKGNKYHWIVKKMSNFNKYIAIGDLPMTEETYSIELHPSRDYMLTHGSYSLSSVPDGTWLNVYGYLDEITKNIYEIEKADKF